jgi:hypothetical protein
MLAIPYFLVYRRKYSRCSCVKCNEPQEILGVVFLCRSQQNFCTIVPCSLLCRCSSSVTSVQDQVQLRERRKEVSHAWNGIVRCRRQAMSSVVVLSVSRHHVRHHKRVARHCTQKVQGAISCIGRQSRGRDCAVCVVTASALIARKPGTPRRGLKQSRRTLRKTEIVRFVSSLPAH